MAVLIRKIVHPGKMPVFYGELQYNTGAVFPLVVLTLDIVPEGGLE
jgi:hypothetical protein